MCTGEEWNEKKWEMTGRSDFLSLSSLSPSQNCLSQDAVIVSCNCSLTSYKIMIVVLLFPNHDMLEMFCHFVFLHQSNTVPDPDLEINKVGGPSFPSIFFLAPWASVWSGSATTTQPCPKGFLVAIPSTSNYSVLQMSFSKYHNCLTNLVNVTCSLI